MSDSTVRIVDTAPQVFVVGMTRPYWPGITDFMDAMGRTFLDQDGADRTIPDDLGYASEDPEVITRIGGNVCYASWHNPGKKNDEDYVAKQIVERHHGSVLQHASLNLILRDVPRSTQLELARHAIGMEDEWESQRFYLDDVRMVMPPLYRNDAVLRRKFIQKAEAEWFDFDDHLRAIKMAYPKATRKQTYEAARCFLPNCFGSNGLLTFNGRALRYILAVRSATDADASIRELAVNIYETVVEWLPGTLRDGQFGPNDEIVFEHG